MTRCVHATKALSFFSSKSSSRYPRPSVLAMDLCHERSSFRWSDEDQQPRCRNPSAASNRQGIGAEARNQVRGTLASALSVISAMPLRARSSPAGRIRSSRRWNPSDCYRLSFIFSALPSFLILSGIMARSSKLAAVRRGKVLLVRRRRDRRWMFPGGRKRARENEKDCLRREIRDELPKLKLGRIRLWKEVKSKNRRSGRRMSDAIFVASKATGT